MDGTDRGDHFAELDRLHAARLDPSMAHSAGTQGGGELDPVQVIEHNTAMDARHGRFALKRLWSALLEELEERDRRR